MCSRNGPSSIHQQGDSHKIMPPSYSQETVTYNKKWKETSTSTYYIESDHHPQTFPTPNSKPKAVAAAAASFFKKFSPEEQNCALYVHLLELTAW